MLKQKIALTLATVGGAGYFPCMPGTFTSALTALFFYFFVPAISWPVFLLVLSVLLALGVWSSQVASTYLNAKDPGCIVIDEVVGMGLALALIPHIWWVYVISFVLFRILDMVKPYPIHHLERLPGGWGVMIDDVAAGLVARVILAVVLQVVF